MHPHASVNISNALLIVEKASKIRRNKCYRDVVMYNVSQTQCSFSDKQ